jgi:hypothetical protein
MRALPVAFVLLGLAASARAEAPAAPAEAQLSDVLKAKRPTGGEHLGLYLLGKKIGYMFSDLSFAPGTKDKVRSVEEYTFKLGVGSKIAERRLKNIRVYEAKPGGRLLSFTVEQIGDGGDQTLEATATPAGLTVVRKRPNQPNQVLTYPAVQERVEDADQARVAVYRNQTVEGVITDASDLGQYKVTTTVHPPEERTLNGVKVKLFKVVSISEKEKIPAEVSVTEQGEMVEIRFGDNMVARAEPESVAKRLDQAEVFGLTRVELPAQLPANARGVPGSVTLVMSGLPERFWKDTYRQKFKKLSDGRVEVTLMASPPKLAKPMVRPLADPNGGVNLKSTLVVEADNPEIQRTAKKIVGRERNAYLAAKKIVDWVGNSMVKDYGSSADRASDVLHQMRGDCTEHALLSVALLRAAGIPAKRVDGVVYLVNEDNVPALYWHEWVEAYVGEWTQMDPTFGQTVADATHFGVGEEGNAEIVPLIGQMKVLAVR